MQPQDFHEKYEPRLCSMVYSNRNDSAISMKIIEARRGVGKRKYSMFFLLLYDFETVNGGGKWNIKKIERERKKIGVKKRKMSFRLSKQKVKKNVEFQ